MNTQKIIPLIKGSIKHLPGIKPLLTLRDSKAGTSDTEYCYSVWMRHLKNWSTINNHLPEVVAEVGPGATLGTCFAALLSGCQKVYALEAVKLWDVEKNLQLFEELVILFKNKSSIPDNQQFPKVRPLLNTYDFPSDILSEAQLTSALAEERLNQIRAEIKDIDNPNNSFITYFIPWYERKVIEKKSVDFIFSQAVLQSVNDLNNTYEAMDQWIKPTGIMSHTIDFKSLKTTKYWNDHWTYNEFEWKIIKGGRSYLINGLPCSAHLALQDKFGFHIVSKQLSERPSKIKAFQISKQFKSIVQEEDLTISGMYVLSRKNKS